MSTSPSSVKQGYLLLADISGYTSFLTRTELDHSHEILTDLLETVLKRLKSLLTVHKIEGDAIFAYSPQERIIRGETLLELIEATYTDFRERMKNVRRHTTCTCRACQSIPLLDLKFMAHHGDFVVQNISGIRELAGADVNLVHRLLKNHVAENTGWHAYALFTQAALDSMQLKLEGLTQSAESYEHLGETTVFCMDLHARYEALLQARHIVVEPGEAIISFAEEINAPPPVVWSWMNEPEKRKLYSLDPHGLEFIPILRPGGRTGAGATTHCVHGKNIAMSETVLDWKPFDYFTVEQDSGPMGIIEVTCKLEPVKGDKTRVRFYLTGKLPKLPGLLGRLAIKFIFTRLFDYRIVATKLKQIVEDQVSEGSAVDARPEVATGPRQARVPEAVKNSGYVSTLGEVQQGYLLLADISGYTSFLTKTELDHSHEILTDLLETVLKRLKSLLTVHKIEGDAIFAYSPQARIIRGETLLELIEATYTDFRERMKNVRRHTTCTCRACQSIPLLDLKFMAHHGDFVLQNISGIRELAGADVNLVHRLLKNHVAENTGWHAYALFTQAALDSMQLKLEGLTKSAESYEHLGETTIFCMDLHARYEALLQARHIVVEPGEAHRVLEYQYAAPVEVIWEWFNDPRKRGKWMHTQILAVLGGRARLAAGGRNHCVHGKNEVVVEDVLDIKTPEYYTVDHQPKGGPVTLRMTFAFEPSPAGGTHFCLMLRTHARFMPEWVGRLVTNQIVENTIKRHWSLDRIDQLIAAETSPC